jgi:G3E family GTPase
LVEELTRDDRHGRAGQEATSSEAGNSRVGLPRQTIIQRLTKSLRYGIGSFVYRARRPFDPLKLYRLIEGKFILLQDEVEEEEEEEDENEDEAMSDSDVSRPSAGDSDETNEDGESLIDDATILANKKASLYFRGLHRSKGIFWLATRPFQMGSWSTAGAMLTLGSEMPWFCCVSEEEWAADDDTMKAIQADFEGEWGDRRQELVLIGEQLDVDGLTKLLDSCLLSRAEMRKWEKIMHDRSTDDEAKEERLCEMWDEEYWAEWPRAEHDHEHGEEAHRHGHSHAH